MARRTRTTKTAKPKLSIHSLDKVPTHIPGLDDVLHGGLPAGRTSIVSGGPGSGKSVLAMEFLYRGAVAGTPGIFVTFEERAEAVRQNALAMGWDLAALEAEGKFFLLHAHVDPAVVVSGDFDLQGLLSIVEGKAEAMGAQRITVDAIDVLLQLFDDPKRERKELYSLHEWLIDHHMTAVITVKDLQETGRAAHYEFLDFMADCVLRLDNRVAGQIATRRIRVRKYRGSGFGRNEYPFVIVSGGMHIIPITTLELRHQALGAPVSSGHPRFDAILSGGFRRASSVLVTGPAGTGKTTLAATLATAACRRGERVLYISFEESAEALVSTLLSPGIDLRPALKDGTLRISSAMPEAVGAERHLHNTLQAMRQFGPDHVVLDAISSCQRMGSEQAAFEFVVLLINACKERGTTIFLTNQATGLTEEQEISGIGVSSLMDTVVVLRYLHVGGEATRTLLVMKARGTKHSNQIREFRITDNGIDVADVYVGAGGVLTGVARQEQEAREEAERMLKQQEIETKEQELAARRAALDADLARHRAEVTAAEAELEQLKLARRVREDDRVARGSARGKPGDRASAEKPRRRGSATRARAKGGAK